MTNMMDNASPDDSADALADALVAAKLRVAQLKGWHAFAKLRDGNITAKPRKAKARKSANGASEGGDASADLPAYESEVQA